MTVSEDNLWKVSKNYPFSVLYTIAKYLWCFMGTSNVQLLMLIFQHLLFVRWGCEYYIMIKLHFKPSCKAMDFNIPKTIKTEFTLWLNTSKYHILAVTRCGNISDCVFRWGNWNNTLTSFRSLAILCRSKEHTSTACAMMFCGSTCWILIWLVIHLEAKSFIHDILTSYASAISSQNNSL